jgi:hypothetical protein
MRRTVALASAPPEEDELMSRPSLGLCAVLALALYPSFVTSVFAGSLAGPLAPTKASDVVTLQFNGYLSV